MQDRQQQRLEITLPPSLKQQFFSECSRRGYLPSRVIRLAIAEALANWKESDSPSDCSEIFNPHAVPCFLDKNETDIDDSFNQSKGRHIEQN